MRRHSLIYAGLWLCKLPPLVWAHPRPSSSAGLGGVGAASAPALDLRPERLAVLRPAFAHTRTTTGGPCWNLGPEVVGHRISDDERLRAIAC
jgi:hypothetical protein